MPHTTAFGKASAAFLEIGAQGKIDTKNLALVKLELPEHTTADTYLHERNYERLSIETICTALQNDCTIPTLRWYLQQCKSATSEAEFSETMKRYGCSALFFAAARNSVQAVQTLLEFGADPDVYECSRIPLLAFAILHGESASVNTSNVVKQLLAHGANPYVIPEDMWIEYWNDPTLSMTKKPKPEAAWCNSFRCRSDIIRALHLTHRYALYRASILEKHTPRELQLASAHKITDLFKIPYFMVGQLPAARLVIETVFSHITNHNPRPLVMVFAGPSGHGKTELAEQMGDLLSIKHEKFACEKMRNSIDLLGGTNSYQRSMEGSEFNNFVADNDGRRAVVIMDEFDKTTDEVRLALLNLLDKGTTHDRRNNRAVDCSKLIWILTTNFGDTTISSYYKRKIHHLSEEARQKVNLTPLQQDLVDAFKQKYGAPLTGRTRLMVPFLPFSHAEAAAVSHKFFMDFQDRKRLKIDLREDVNRYIAHIDLHMDKDGEFCSHIASRYYDEDSGARSVLKAIDLLEVKLTQAYMRPKELVIELTNEQPLQKYNVRLVPQGGDKFDMGVFPDSDNDGQRNGNGGVAAPWPLKYC